jgi:hypothetical protein
MPTYTVDVISYLMGVISGTILVFALVALVRITGRDE